MCSILWTPNQIATRNRISFSTFLLALSYLGWLPSATELQYLGAGDDMVDLGVFPTIFALLTLGGYRINSMEFDGDKSVLVLEHGEKEVQLQTIRVEFCKLGATRAVPDGPCKVMWYVNYILSKLFLCVLLYFILLTATTASVSLSLVNSANRCYTLL